VVEDALGVWLDHLAAAHSLVWLGRELRAQERRGHELVPGGHQLAVEGQPEVDVPTDHVPGRGGQVPP
jgi:hypothetical protein